MNIGLNLTLVAAWALVALGVGENGGGIRMVSLIAFFRFLVSHETTQ